jgi:LPPG:FO 2-phospho-L-lactate transferase
MSAAAHCRILALCGGVGGAKLCLGLHRMLPSGALAIAVNSGDDFEHFGLRICPDVDTVLYTLAGLANSELGWGRGDETWSFMQTLESLGGETWFRLGDRDLALHAERTRRLAAGETLSAITADFAQRLGIGSTIVPMSDDPVRTMVRTPEGELPFQHYFVRERCAPVVRSLRFAGVEDAAPAEGVMRALRSPALEAIVITPSNPYLSIDPILSLPGLRASLRAAGVPIVAVTPVIGGEAVKGPTAKIMRELGLVPSPLTVAEHYGNLIDGFVLDERDADLAGKFDRPVQICNTWMKTLTDREVLAMTTLNFAASLRAQRGAVA